MLLGRGAEQQILDELLQRARAGRSAVLVLRGEPGIGKTALLDYARANAAGMTVLHCVGIELHGLAEGPAHALLETRLGQPASAEVVTLLVRTAQGNPLALLELPLALTNRQLQGADPIAGPLRAKGAVEESFRIRVARLSAGIRRALLLAAAEESGDLHTLEPALERCSGSHRGSSSPAPRSNPHSPVRASNTCGPRAARRNRPHSRRVVVTSQPGSAPADDDRDLVPRAGQAGELPGDRLVRLAAHGADRTPQHVGHLRLGQVLQIPQHQHHPLTGRKSQQRLRQQVGPGRQHLAELDEHAAGLFQRGPEVPGQRAALIGAGSPGKVGAQPVVGGDAGDLQVPSAPVGALAQRPDRMRDRAGPQPASRRGEPARAPACWAAAGPDPAHAPAWFVLPCRATAAPASSQGGTGTAAQRIVDTYAVQHATNPDRRNRQSVALHLMSLCASLEQEISGTRLRRTIGDWTHREYPLLVPRAAAYPVTVRDVADTDQRSRPAIVNDWATSAWTAWSAHHDTVRAWLAQAMQGSA